MKRWLIAAIILQSLWGCGLLVQEPRGAADDARSAVDISEAEGSHVVAAPISMPRTPGEFLGDDTGFLSSFQAHVANFEIAQVPADAQLIAYGRQFCSVLSGGGLLAVKVDSWGGASRIPTDVDVPVFLAAFDAYCPEYAQGYANVQLGSDKVEPTEAERADLVRFVAGLPGTIGVPDLARIPDEDLGGRASQLCAAPHGDTFLSDPLLQRLTESVPAHAQRGFVVGLLMMGCPEQVEQFGAWARGFGN